MDEFHNSNELLAALVVSIYVLGFALGPLILAPLSEVYGRWIVYFVCNVLWVVFTLCCAVSTNIAMAIVFRFLAGCFGSSPLALGGGSIADMFDRDQRGLAVAIYSIGPICGPAIGPVAGGFLAVNKGWRWSFWLLTILVCKNQLLSAPCKLEYTLTDVAQTGAVTVVQFFLTSETFAPVVLERKTKRLRKETGNPNLRSKLDTQTPLSEVLLRAIIRPTKMCLVSPISIFLSVSSAYVYGIYYLLLTTFTLVFENTYGFSTQISGLSYIGLGVGNAIGWLFFTFTSDRYVQYRASQGKARPEDRLPHLLLSGPLICVGLFWFGWSSQEKTHWIVPIIGSAVTGTGQILFFLPVVAYLVDAFTTYAASALAANTVLRSIGGALLPLAGQSMFKSLGLGWGSSLLGFLTLAFCPVLFILYIYGERIRTRYPINL